MDTTLWDPVPGGHLGNYGLWRKDLEPWLRQITIDDKSNNPVHGRSDDVLEAMSVASRTHLRGVDGASSLSSLE